eukprot:1065522-Prorocentrum_minimum.AAC.3
MGLSTTVPFGVRAGCGRAQTATRKLTSSAVACRPPVAAHTHAAHVYRTATFSSPSTFTSLASSCASATTAICSQPTTI